MRKVLLFAAIFACALAPSALPAAQIGSPIPKKMLHMICIAPIRGWHKLATIQPVFYTNIEHRKQGKIVRILTGIASFYGGRWVGRKTANGEIYKKGDMTAAHKELPFNTKIRVTNLRNGCSVTLRVNNRGPYIGTRILDVSEAAAKELQMIGSGLAKVKIEILDSRS